jgi:hypothetical protein
MQNVFKVGTCIDYMQRPNDNLADGPGFVAEQERDATISREAGGWFSERWLYVTRIIRSSGIVTSPIVHSLGHHDIINVPKFCMQLGTRCVHIEDL